MRLLNSFIRCIMVGGVGFMMTGTSIHAQNKPQTRVQTPSVLTSAFNPGSYPTGLKVNYVRAWEPMGAYTDSGQVLTESYQHVRQSTQYLDGLGRPIQTVQKQASPAALDLVAPIHYDEFGREQYKFLPYIQSSGSNTNDGSFKMDPFNNQLDFYQSNYTDANNQLMLPGEQLFYGKTDFEASPMHRVGKAMAPGNSWTGSSVGMEMKYLVNSTNDAVRIWKISSNSLTYSNEDVATNIPVSDSIYNTGELYKTITKDEHGKAVVEYKDKEGQIILKKVQISSVPTDFSGHDGFLCTYYVFDDLNQLRFVIPPKAVEEIKSSWVLTTNVINELCFRYEYDGRKRMVAKKVPGAGWVYMVYDVRDRLVFSQDANLRAGNKWMTTLYDELNRPVMTGVTMYSYGSPPHVALQQAVNTQTAAPSNPNTTLQSDVLLNTSTSGTVQAMRSITLTEGFENNANQEFTAEIIFGPGGSNGETTLIENIEVNKNPIPWSYAAFAWLAITYYDNYNFTNTTYTTTYNNLLNAGTNLHVETLPSTASQQVKGMITGSKVRVLDDPNNQTTGKSMTSVNFYDEKGRVIQTHSENYSGGTDIQTSLYNFSGSVLSTYLAHRNPASSNPEIRIRTDYSYDHALRLLEVNKVINDDNSKKVTIAKNSYDALGNLMKKELGRKRNTDGSYSSTPLEVLDYTYNVRGWMKGINAGYSHSELPGSSAQSGRYFGMELSYDWGFDSSQFNGNIGGIRWRSKGDGEQRAYGFSYDNANRILKADFTQFTNGDFSQSAGVNYNVKMGDGINTNTAYDPNGNIKQMQQWGLKMGSSPQIDNLSYSYHSASNKLEKVTDGNSDPNTKLGDFRDGNNTGNDYNYDLNGNLVLDNNKSISSITYNHLNLPSVITITGKGTVSYVYDASGTKLQKRTVDNTVSPAKTTTTSYIGGAVYVNDTLQFLGHEEGRIRLRTTDNTYQYDYFIKDHLGNVRMVLSDELRQDKYPVASLESVKTAIEDSIYTIDRSKVVNASSVTGIPFYTNDNGIGSNPSDPAFEQSNSQKLYQLNSSTNKMGLGIALKVMAGDRLDIFGKSYWFNSNTGGTSVNSAPMIIDLLNGLMGTPTGAVSGSHTTAAELYGISAVAIPIGSFIIASNRDETSFPQRPKAFINYIFLDEQFKYVSGGFSAVNDVSGLKNHYSELQNLIAGKNGYVYIYCSNESPVNVFFDNLQVVHTRGPLLEETHYYPFGLTMAGISSKALNNAPANKNKFNGIEHNTDFDLNMYDAFYRNMDPQIGRFWQIDPKLESTEAWSPYAAMMNNPIRYADPLGDTVVLPNATEKFQKQFTEATSLLIAKGAGDLYIQAVESNDKITVLETTDENSSYDPKTKTISWNPTVGVAAENGDMSATAVLNHEIDHAVQHDKNPKQFKKDSDTPDKQYSDKEEKRVIKGSEQKTAQALGEMPKGIPTRTNHKGQAYPTIGPTSTKSFIQGKLEEQIKNKKGN